MLTMGNTANCTSTVEVQTLVIFAFQNILYILKSFYFECKYEYRSFAEREQVAFENQNEGIPAFLCYMPCDSTLLLYI